MQCIEMFRNILVPSELPLSQKWLVIVIQGLGVTCLPRDLGFTGSNPTEVDGFFQDVNIEHKSSGRDFKLGSESEISGLLNNPKPEKIGL